MRNPLYISLFSGAGGLDIGLERAGFRAISLCEIEPIFCETLRANQGRDLADGRAYLKNARILNADIREISAKELSAGSQADLVVGGPPCQAFSSSGKQLSVLDPRGLLIHEFIRLIDEVRPRTFLFENVRGLVTARDGGGEPGGVIHGLLKRFQNLGYSCRASLLNAADHGAPQRRVRCFIIGSRRGTAPLFPEPTHQKTADMFHKPWVSLRSFLEMYADPDPTQYVYPTKALARDLCRIPDGSGLISPGRTENTRPGGHWGYRQGTFISDTGLPARTVMGSASQDWIRWQGVLRRLTLREVTLLQGFPRDWEILGTKAQRFKQVGNAVPTVFGELLGGVLRTFLAAYPSTPPEKLEIPNAFKNYIDYTKKDHDRNAACRVVYRTFSNSPSPSVLVRESTRRRRKPKI
jgi:DNA (cytosine-5)-methyltransferase 1